MSSKALAFVEFEDLLQNVSSHTTMLPPLWQVIYYEGIRSNHLLFSELDVKLFEAAIRSFDTRLSEDDVHWLEEMVVNLLSCSELKQMRTQIQAQPTDRRHLVYLVYRRVLDLWRDSVKTQLN